MTTTGIDLVPYHWFDSHELGVSLLLTRVGTDMIAILRRIDPPGF